MSDLVTQLSGLGIKFLYSEEEGNMILYAPTGMGDVEGGSRIDITKEELESYGLGDLIVTIPGVVNTDVLRSLGYNVDRGLSIGDIKSVDDLTAFANQYVENIRAALVGQPGDTIQIGNEEYSRSEMEDLIGETVAYDPSVQLAAEAASAGIKDNDGLVPETTYSGNSRVGEGVNTVQGSDGKWSVVGANTGTVYGSGYATAAEAQSQANLVVGGSTAQATGAFAPGGSEYTPSGTTEEDFANDVASSMSDAESAALAENPSLVITAEMRAQFYADAVTDLAPYYEEVISNIETTTGVSFDRLIEDITTQETALAEEYRQGLKSLQSDLQARGMLYGGVRETEESELATAANVEAAALETELTRGLEDISLAFSQQLGTEAATEYGAGLGTTSLLGRALPGVPTFTIAGATNIYQPIGEFTQETATVPSERALAETELATELESTYLNELTRTL